MKITVSYGRKIRPSNHTYEYETEELQVHVGHDLPDTAEEEGPDGAETVPVTYTDEQIEDEVKRLTLIAQSHALDTLGIPFTIDEQGRVVEQPQSVANVAQAFPGSTVHPSQGSAPPAQTPASAPAPSAPAASSGPAPIPQPAQTCPQCGGAMWDNRADNDRRRRDGYKLSVDFKCKNSNCKNEKGYVTAIWPEDYRDYKNLPAEPRR